MRKIIAILLPVLILAACDLPRSAPKIGVPPATEAPSQPCAFNWATQPLPELSKQVQEAMEAAGLTNITVRAEAYGETCTSGQPSQTPSFGALETDFHITVKVLDLTHKEDLGILLEKILVVLDAFPIGEIPGPQPGYVGISFQADGEELNLWFQSTDGKTARDQGLKGAALLDRLIRK
jgi:hypothetical protein